MSDSNENPDLKTITRSEVAALTILIGSLLGAMRDARMITPDAIENLLDECRKIINQPNLAYLSRHHYTSTLAMVQSAANATSTRPPAED